MVVVYKAVGVSWTTLTLVILGAGVFVIWTSAHWNNIVNLECKIFFKLYMHIYLLTYVLYYKYFKGSSLTVGFLMTFFRDPYCCFTHLLLYIYISIPSPPLLEFPHFPNFLIKSLVTCYSRFYCFLTPYSSYPRIFFFTFLVSVLTPE